MKLRRLLIGGGVALAAAAVVLVPSGSGASFGASDRYQGKLKGSQTGATVLVTESGSHVCTINAGQVVDVDADANGGRKAFGASSINWTLSATVGTQTSSVASGSLATFAETDDLGGTVIPCATSSLSVTFTPVGCATNGDCQSDSITGVAINSTYSP